VQGDKKKDLIGLNSVIPQHVVRRQKFTGASQPLGCHCRGQFDADFRKGRIILETAVAGS
jgi:hypothetical protein